MSIKKTNCRFSNKRIGLRSAAMRKDVAKRRAKQRINKCVIRLGKMDRFKMLNLEGHFDGENDCEHIATDG